MHVESVPVKLQLENGRFTNNEPKIIPTKRKLRFVNSNMRHLLQIVFLRNFSTFMNS